MVLVSPAQGLKIVVQRQPVGWAVIFAIFFSAIVTASFLPSLSTSMENILGRPMGGEGLWLIFLMAIISLVGLFIGAGILHLIALLLGGKGNYQGLFCGLSLANLPSLFSAPLAFLSRLMGLPGEILYSLGSLALSAWIMVLSLLALRYNYGFSTGKAALTFFLPALALLVIFILLALIPLALTGI